jgi:DNA-binding LytR/AlgR family response regulator
VIVFATAASGHTTVSILDPLMERLGWPNLLRLPLGAVCAAVSVCATLLLIWLAFGQAVSAAVAVDLYGDCLVVVGGVMALGTLMEQQQKPKRLSEQGSGHMPKLLNRLPGGKRGRLIRLRAQDHYVEVVTENGSTLLAMRFCDAVAEAAPEPGAQIHRSHWVAEHAIMGQARRGQDGGFQLKDGSSVPIGRSFRPALREKGLLL